MNNIYRPMRVLGQESYENQSSDRKRSWPSSARCSWWERACGPRLESSGDCALSHSMSSRSADRDTWATTFLQG